MTFTRLDDNSKHTVVVVGNIGADPTANPPAVSNESPLGAALLDHGVGDVCTVDGPHTYQVRIDSFRLN